MENDDIVNDIGTIIKNSDNICISGGASGADVLFGIYALKKGHSLIHLTHKNAKISCYENECIRLPDDILQDKNVLEQLKKANLVLERSVPNKNSDVYRLLARNSFQIKWTDRVYAITGLASPTTVEGGTAWAVEMYRQLAEQPEIYIYDLNTKNVFYYSSTEHRFIRTDKVPSPYGIWTGIGSRKATEADLADFITYFEESY